MYIKLRSCHLEPKKVSIHGPNRPRNEKNQPEKIMHGAVKFIGALIVNIHLNICNKEYIFGFAFDFMGSINKYSLR